MKLENTDLDLIWNACLAEDRKAQFKLYQLFSSKMFAVCLRYARDQDEAADILQTGFIKVFSKSHLFDHKGSLEGWIRRIMVNTAIEMHRKNKTNFLETLQEQHHSIPESQQRSDDNIHYKDLMQLVTKLPMGYKTVFNLYAIEGYSHKEIADMLIISEGNSKSQLSRARQWLKEKLIHHNMQKI